MRRVLRRRHVFCRGARFVARASSSAPRSLRVRDQHRGNAARAARDGSLPLERGGGPAGDRKSAREEHPVTERRPRRKSGPSAGRLAETPDEERPREKKIRKGPDALDDEELLAIVLGTGTAANPVMETARLLLKEGGLGASSRRAR